MQRAVPPKQEIFYQLQENIIPQYVLRRSTDDIKTISLLIFFNCPLEFVYTVPFGEEPLEQPWQEQRDHRGARPTTGSQRERPCGLWI